jgi:DNA repair exonuclease SbcCD ATPase subunit
LADDFEDPSLNVEVRTTADTGGVDQVAKGLDQVSERSGGLTHSLRELTGTSRHASEVIRGIEAAGRGGAAGIGEMVRGLRALIVVTTEAVGASGLGALALVAGAVLGAFIALGRHAHDASGEIKKTGDESAEAAKKMEEIKKAVDDAFKPLEEELKRINEQFATLDKRISEATRGAGELQKASKDLADSELELGKARETANAKSPEEIEYINKKYEGLKREADAKQALNEVDQPLLDAQVRQAAATDKATQTSALAAEGANNVKSAQDALAAEREKARREVGSAAQDEINAAAGVGVDTAIGPTKDQAAAEAQATADAKAKRDAAFARVDEKQKALDEAKAKQDPLEAAAEKARVERDIATKNVEDEQLAVQKEQLAAINKLAAAIIDKQQADDAKVTGGGQSKEELDKEGDKATADAEKAEVKHEKSEQKADAKAATEEVKEQTKLTKEMAEASRHHTKALKDLHDSHQETAKVAVRVSKETTRTKSEVVNRLAEDTSP